VSKCIQMVGFTKANGIKMSDTVEASNYSIMETHIKVSMYREELPEKVFIRGKAAKSMTANGKTGPNQDMAFGKGHTEKAI